MSKQSTMTRHDIADYLTAATTGITRQQAIDALDALEECVTHALTEGRDVRLVGLGTLSAAETPARSGSVAGRSYSTQPGRRVKFRPTAALRAAVKPQ